MVNSYISDVFFNMDHGFNPDAQPGEKEFENINENAEMFISMLTECRAVNVPTVEELKNNFFDTFFNQ